MQPGGDGVLNAFHLLVHVVILFLGRIVASVERAQPTRAKREFLPHPSNDTTQPIHIATHADISIVPASPWDIRTQRKEKFVSLPRSRLPSRPVWQPALSPFPQQTFHMPSPIVCFTYKKMGVCAGVNKHPAKAEKNTPRILL